MHFHPSDDKDSHEGNPILDFKFSCMNLHAYLLYPNMIFLTSVAF